MAQGIAHATAYLQDQRRPRRGALSLSPLSSSSLKPLPPVKLGVAVAINHRQEPFSFTAVQDALAITIEAAITETSTNKNSLLPKKAQSVKLLFVFTLVSPLGVKVD